MWRQLLSGGDVLSVSHVQRALAHLPERGRLINGYGPTENTTFTCCHVMTAESRVESTVPIGRPIANTQVYVLDRAMQPVPVGVYGNCTSRRWAGAGLPETPGADGGEVRAASVQRHSRFPAVPHG